MTQWIGLGVRFVVSAIVLLLVSFIAPGFVVRGGFIGALIAAAVIALIGYLAESLFGDKVSPQARGLVGFITSAVVIYLAQFVIPMFLSVSLVGALISAFIIGIIDAIVPTVVR